MWCTFSRGAGFQKLNSSTVPMHYSLLYVCILQNDIFRKVSVIAMVLSLKKFLILNMYSLIGPVVKALTCKAEDHSSNLTRDHKKILFDWK